MMAIAAPFLGLIDPHVSAMVAGGAIVADLFGREQLESRLYELKNSITDRMGAVELSNEEFAAKIGSPLAQEVLTRAVLQTLWTPRVSKIRRFGAIVGSQLAASSPNWDEAAEFVADLETLGDDDVRFLKVLWDVQQSAYRMATASGRGMSTDANEYTPSWTRVIGEAAVSGTAPDDLYARCGRLTGFGLVQAVQNNGAHQGPDHQCYRTTGRAVRLLRLLGVVDVTS
jgi:hypothetical protein